MTDIPLQGRLPAEFFRVLLPRMAERPEQHPRGVAKVVAVASSVSLGTPPKYVAAYSAAKGALLGLVKGKRTEYVIQVTTSNAVAPSMVETQFLRDLPEKAVEIAAAQHPRRRNASLATLYWRSPSLWVRFRLHDGHRAPGDRRHRGLMPVHSAAFLFCFLPLVVFAVRVAWRLGGGRFRVAGSGDRVMGVLFIYRDAASGGSARIAGTTSLRSEWRRAQARRRDVDGYCVRDYSPISPFSPRPNTQVFCLVR